MSPSRRKFISATLTGVAGLALPGSILSACNILNRKKELEHLDIEFIGLESYFPVYEKLFRKSDKVTLLYHSLEEAFFKTAHASIVFLPAVQKASVIVMLLEQGKDILTPAPLANDLYEFDFLQKACNMYNRRLSILDPYRFYTSYKLFREIARKNRTGKISEVQIRLSPQYDQSSWLPGNTSGYSGFGASLIRMASCLLALNARSLEVTGIDPSEGQIPDEKLFMEIDLGKVILYYNTDDAIRGWDLNFHSEKGTISFDSDDNLTFNGDFPEMNAYDLQQADPNLAVIRAINDFLNCVRTRQEPAVNILDGMAGILLNQAAMQSAGSGEKVQIIMEPG